ncbi:extracellular solute-binding protein [Streptomyces sp. LX-29]|uniref:ABC transporter substrate-binding protein n=1 Tax=Streptomyces sp. LX-29 TaxID=2900152 RepID=UPI00240D065C|nr:extracellular solute-binding protein [Streptomyces sp. LX-29]WFB11469.1 extracellular solute-binding protein [Streptomyces sp. LX-29]
MPALPRVAALTCGLAVTVVALSACGTKEDSVSTDGKNAKTATSAEEMGGMNALITAAQQEGTLNAIALPRDWANYGQLIDGFQDQYGIEVKVENPNGSSQDEINAITSRKGRDNAPDVVDLGSSFAVGAADQGLLAPYRVADFDHIPETQKDAKARWYNDYGGYISIGCDAERITNCPKTFADLLKPEFTGKVALNGDPTKAGAAFAAVYAAALANGGSFENIQPGLDFFAELKRNGKYATVEPTPATIVAGQTPIIIDWDYLNVGYAQKLKAKGVDWQVEVPDDGEFAQYYSQAINKDAPHPAAARLWQEYVYSAEGQNTYLYGYARPALMTAMAKDGTLDRNAAAKLPPVIGVPSFPTEAQQAAAKQTLARGWREVASG